ncbi:hypothetical protein [Francisella uliginis]|uniref:Uncharacterized protein n=1 Tax=Francisella uliginis TaxID=573570 RepID=A0A1L4BS34_9GAMM|nr:hypothetical protein [Francisella uliginis]API86645.1 hypothetical protein F7310_04395 [Francisella uliginis]
MKKFVNIFFVFVLALCFSSVYAVNLSLMKTNISKADQQDKSSSSLQSKNTRSTIQDYKNKNKKI